MAAAKKVRNKEEEEAARLEGDYNNHVDEYEDKKKGVVLAIDMVETAFWKLGFKTRRDTYDRTHKAFIACTEEQDAEDYDSIEYMKALNKTKLAFSKAAKDFDNFVADVQFSVDVLHTFCQREDLPLFADLTLMTAKFSRKTGKITMKKVK